VRDINGLIVYTEGVDYTVIVSPARVEIRRIIGGDIAPGETVLVDYSILPLPGGETTTLGLGLSVRYTFEEGPLLGLSLFSELLFQDENRDGPIFGDERDEENDFTEYRIGTEYNRAGVYMKAERRVREGSFDPFEGSRFEGRYIRRIGSSGSVRFNALFEDLDRTDDDLRTKTLTLSAQWSQQFTRRLRGTLLVLWQDEDIEPGSDAQGFEQELNVRWERGQTELYARIRNSIRDTDVDDTMFQTLFVGLRSSPPSSRARRPAAARRRATSFPRWTRP
jgi:hypothetical protein